MKRQRDGWWIWEDWESYAQYRHPLHPDVHIHHGKVKAHQQMGYRYTVYLHGAGPGGSALLLRGFDKLADAKAFVTEGKSGWTPRPAAADGSGAVNPYVKADYGE